MDKGRGLINPGLIQLIWVQQMGATSKLNG